MQNDDSGNKSSAFAQHHEALNVNLQRSLASLLTRFRDDDEQLAILARLLECCDFSTTHSSSASSSKTVGGSAKSLKGLLKILADIFLVSGDGQVLRRVVRTLLDWTMEMQDASLVALVTTSMADLMQACWQTVEDSSDRLRSELAEASVTTSKGNRRRSSPPSVEVLETVRSLSSAVGRFKLLCKNFNCTAVQKSLVSLKGVNCCYFS